MNPSKIQIIVDSSGRNSANDTDTENNSNSNSVGDTEIGDTERVIMSADNRNTEIQNSLNDNQGEEIPPVRVKLLREIYENCSFALTASDLVTFEEAEKNPEWRRAMEIELSAIERNNTWELS